VIENKSKGDIEKGKRTKMVRMDNEIQVDKKENSLKVSSVVATLGKISGLIKRTRATVKYKNFSSLTSKQKMIINDLASAELSEKDSFTPRGKEKLVGNLKIRKFIF
jgi:hypothetical protein